MFASPDWWTAEPASSGDGMGPEINYKDLSMSTPSGDKSENVVDLSVIFVLNMGSHCQMTPVGLLYVSSLRKNMSFDL